MLLNSRMFETCLIPSLVLYIISKIHRSQQLISATCVTSQTLLMRLRYSLPALCQETH
jgi:hypothetical protein